MAVHLHLLVLVFILLVPTPQQARGNVSPFSPIYDQSAVTINFEVRTDGYKAFLDELRGVLLTRRTVGTGDLRVPVLAQQRKDHVNLVHVSLVGVAHRTTIAVRRDNIYIVGFTNSTGHWFELKFKGTHAHLIRGSTWLPFGGCYPDLVKGGRKKLTGIKLGKENMLKAVHMLARHNPNHPNDIDGLKVALARLCVMVAEAERFVPIKDTVAQDWNGTPQINDTQANYVVLWGDMSCALLRWQKRLVRENKWVWEDKGNKLKKKAKINGPVDALRTLGLVLWSNGFSFDAITADDGKPLADDSSTTCNGTPCN